jgi:hypothetical protein
LYGYTTDSRIEKVGASDVRIFYITALQFAAPSHGML